MEIATTKTLALAQLYDELSRKDWAERAKRGAISRPAPKQCFAPFACAGDEGFDVNQSSLRRDVDIYERAIEMHAASAPAQRNNGPFACTYMNCLDPFACAGAPKQAFNKGRPNFHNNNGGNNRKKQGVLSL